MWGDLAFVFIEVLLVTLIIHRLLGEREKRTRLEKLNIVIGVFFSEVGKRMLTYFSDFDPRLDRIRKELIVTGEWSDREFLTVSRRLKNYGYDLHFHKVDLDHLQRLLMEKRDFLVRLLENPVLLEHESFTDLLQAAFHMTEELASREDVKQLPEADHRHLAGDMKRVYALLAHQWLDYMKHLKDNYPYLFSLAMRTNPFDQDASPTVG
jgi:hypothetical protein